MRTNVSRRRLDLGDKPTHTRQCRPAPEQGTLLPQHLLPGRRTWLLTALCPAPDGLKAEPRRQLWRNPGKETTTLAAPPPIGSRTSQGRRSTGETRGLFSHSGRRAAFNTPLSPSQMLTKNRAAGADGVMESKRSFVRTPPADTEQEHQNVASSLPSLKSVRSPYIMWQCTKLD
ncbi:unnamed protein product [Pleuronectes platessa]|uniref:Uncharacterized protein n=1 Tax=Pleuronectes platessa TaxID=8262 RepID=A0A9N7YXH0_PLEPL|nr:unnamed protein product [Pleuronectes platessa]